MAASSNGSASSVTSKRTWSSWRKSALSSSDTLPSSASSEPSPSFTSGLTSTRVASSSMKTVHSFLIASTAWSAIEASKPVAATISAALASSTPTCGSIETRAIASGFSCAVTSISTPPSVEAMQR